MANLINPQQHCSEQVHKPLVMLGIDPGIRISGFSIIAHKAGSITLIDCGYIQLKSSESIPLRLKCLHDLFEQKIMIHAITNISLETPFLGKNAQNFLKLGYVRGIIYLLAATHKLTIYEYSPREIKQAITGFGGAQKEQVAHILLRLFPRLITPKKEDATDALAVGLCGIWKGNKPC